MNKKSQIADQIFVYVIALVIVVLVVFFGWKSIRLFMSQSDDVSLIEFRTEVQNSVNLLSSVGSVKVKEFNVPGNARKVCFVDLRKDVNIGGDVSNAHVCYPGPDIAQNDFFVLCDSWQSKVQQNVFLIPAAKNPIFIDKLVVEKGSDNTQEYMKCFEPVQGKISVKFTSVKDGVSVS